MLPHFTRIYSRSFGASRWLLAPERRWLLLLAAAVVALATFLQIGNLLVRDSELLAFDEHLLARVRAMRTPMLSITAIDLTALGSVTLLTLQALVAGVALLLMRDYRGCAQLVLAMLGNGAWTLLTKSWFARARPEMAHRLLEVQGFSFPSGHSSGSAALFITLALVFMPHLRSVRHRVVLFVSCGTLVLLIGLSRVYLGVHYPSDVASGLAFGSAWSLLLAFAFELKGALPRAASAPS